MLLYFLEMLSKFWGIHLPAAFAYSSTRMLLAAITALVTTIVFGPFFIRKLYELKTGQSIRVEDCPMLARLHEKKRDTPTMGGVFLLGSMIISLFLWMDLKSSFTWMLLLTTIWLGFLGGYDDYLKMKFKNASGISARGKLGLQMLLALVIGLYLFWPQATKSIPVVKAPVAKEQIQVNGESRPSKTLTTQEYSSRYYMPFKKNPLFVLTGMGAIVGIFITLFVITGCSNAVNLTDGLDGLVSGPLVLCAGVLALFAFFSNNSEMARYLNILYIEGSGEIAVYLCALIGACLGFLWYNGHPAQVFMGDTGSLALGGILGVSAVLLRRELLLAIVGGIFVAEALSVILQVGSYKLRNKKRIFLCAPLHHHFEYKGWPETKVVLRFWIVGLILAMIGLISLKFQ
jgi:phospho-N-acetylmuramoyl-pentapeptide-transferase